MFHIQVRKECTVSHYSLYFSHLYEQVIPVYKHLVCKFQWKYSLKYISICRHMLGGVLQPSRSFKIRWNVWKIRIKIFVNLQAIQSQTYEYHEETKDWNKEDVYLNVRIHLKSVIIWTNSELLCKKGKV